MTKPSQSTYLNGNEREGLIEEMLEHEEICGAPEADLEAMTQMWKRMNNVDLRAEYNGYFNS